MAEVSAEDRERVEQAVYRVLYEANVSFASAVVVPALADAIEAAGWGPVGQVADREALIAVEAAHPAQEYVEGAWPDGPWAGFGWVCTGCGERIQYQGLTIPAGIPAGAWGMAAHRIDALFASGVIEDRAVVVREAAAKALDDYADSIVAHRDQWNAKKFPVPALRRRAAEYREGKR